MISQSNSAPSPSFNVTNPDIWHEEAGAILNAKPISQGGHYADSICRLDWIAMNHFADMSGNGQGMLLSNCDAYFMKPGNSTVTTLDYTTPQINVLAAGQIDKWLGIENQDGDSYRLLFITPSLVLSALK